ncbi:alpha-1,2-fucosyltransferase [Mucilaginibacter lacusdianchii]|uniref:alpha-1,2-fucosyltransferase n=1 Tax=Mucilaginibacter lacusdianchii TaxID=2684211 RepID=UPI00131C40E0|nr:alpha-1,2-fucosyltransferase [Mucilaginibacter sp. JXJ CY 39]
MIYSKLISGLGNQLFQYAVSRQLSYLRHVPLKLDVSFYETQELRNFKLSHYNIKAEVATQQELDNFFYVLKSKSLRARLYRKIQRLKPRHGKRYFKELEPWVYEPSLYSANSNIYLDGYWQHHRYFEHIDDRIFDELTLKNEQERNNYPIFDMLKADDNAVSIHIRRGDYISDPNAFDLLGVLPLTYYDKAIAYINEQVKAPNYYVFSDDLDWARKNLKLNNDVYFVDIDNGSKDYLELDAMSKCRHHIIANSSFSWWGAYLNRSPNKIVIAPHQWVKPAHINAKIQIQLPAWIKI